MDVPERRDVLSAPAEFQQARAELPVTVLCAVHFTENTARRVTTPCRHVELPVSLRT